MEFKEQIRVVDERENNIYTTVEEIENTLQMQWPEFEPPSAEVEMGKPDENAEELFRDISELLKEMNKTKSNMSDINH